MDRLKRQASRREQPNLFRASTVESPKESPNSRFGWLRSSALLTAAVWSASVLASGCGSSQNDIPPELLAAIQTRSSNTTATQVGNYPTANIGNQVGSTAQNLCFPGWMNPAAAGFDFSQTNEICFSDFFDPAGQEHTLLLVNTAALWCGACKTEYGGQGERPPLRDEIAERQARGLRVLGAVFQGVDHQPASNSDIELWAQVYEVNFPLALDAEFRMGAFTSSDAAPYNALIDTRTMQIVLVLQGDHPAALWPTVDQYLAENPPLAN